MSYRLMAIDESSKLTGCALFVDGEPNKTCLIDKSKIKDSNDRLNEMCLTLLTQIRLWNPDGIYIEHPQGSGKNVLTVSILSEIIGVARGYAVEHKCDFDELSPSEWRRILGFKQGKGMKRQDFKIMSVEYVKNRYGIDTTDDVADAICIGTAVIDSFDEKEK